MSAPRCRVCAGVVGRVWRAREMMLGLRHAFTYGECARCGALQLLDPPADLASYYGGGYYSFGGDFDAEFAAVDKRCARAKQVRDLLTFSEKEVYSVQTPDTRRPLLSLRKLGLSPETRILDVGCGAGRLLYLLRLAGFTNVLGVDVYLPEDRTYASGLTIHSADLGAIAGEWDVIMLHHTFEHLPDPVGALRQAAERLAVGGTILLRLPLCDSFAWWRYRTDWVQLDAPRHLFLHTRRSLTKAARLAGLSIEQIVYDSFEFQFWGSRQYRLDIPLNDARSFGQGAPLFSRRQVEGWKRAALFLNRVRWGDQAAVYLRKPAVDAAAQTG